MAIARPRSSSLQKPVESITHLCRRTARVSSLVLITLALAAFLIVKNHPLPSSNTSVTPPPLVKPNEVHGPRIDHPVTILVDSAREQFSQVLQRQSTSLGDAVTEYKRRYGLDPPPHFDKWFEYAQQHKVPLLDEYDGIMESLHLFWGLAPAALRKSVKNALGSDPFLMAFLIRDGKIKATNGGDEWRIEAIKMAIEPFAQWLPDMDLAFNTHDEARVLLAYDQLTQLNERGRRTRAQHSTKRNRWSTRPADVNAGQLEPSSITPFMDYAHRFTWSVATLPCPPNSPARVATFEGSGGVDDLSAFDNLPLGFVLNRTAFTDVCLTPSLNEKLGVFNMPNAWSVTHDPLPIFSASKMSTFQDILYPAPWYLAKRSNYDQTQDPSWTEKKNVLFWRGSTTSGYSQGGVWHRQERQRFVEAVERPGQGLVLERERTTGQWQSKSTPRSTYHDLFDVHFSHIGQCSEEDCQAQKEYFMIQPTADFEENWKNKFILDIDGNAFSGRFYAFLQSHSLTLKQAMFREWHEDRLVPWVHYLPLGLNATDHLEMMRFLTQEDAGQKLAEEMAKESRRWAFASLRQVDMQAWIFRLLLEYGRLVDDMRHELGFKMA